MQFPRSRSIVECRKGLVFLRSIRVEAMSLLQKMIKGWKSTASSARHDDRAISPAAASQLANLRQFESIGVTHCRLRSAGDERTTPLEHMMDGKRITVAEARQLVEQSEDQIARSVFVAEIEF